MSGGSYNYLCFKDSGDIGAAAGDLAQMAKRLNGLGYAPRAAAATKRVLAILSDDGAIAAAIDDLSDVWHAVEWADSCDWSEDRMRAEIERYETRQKDRPVTDPAIAPPATDPDRNRRAVIPVHGELFHRLLGLPPNVHVHHFAVAQDGFSINVAVTSPDLPECEPGLYAPPLMPTYELIDGRAVLVDAGISAVPNATRWEWNYRYPDTGPTQFESITERQARAAAAHDLSVIVLRREPGTTEWTEAPA